MQDETEVSEAAKADYGNIISDAPKGKMVKAGGTDIDRLLEPGERVVWEGQSSITKTKSTSWVASSIGAWITIILGLLLATMAMMSSSTILAGILMVIISLGAAILLVANGGSVVDKRRAVKAVSYGLTNRHAIITKQDSGGANTTTMIDLTATDAVKMIEKGDGRGTIVFGRNAVNTYAPGERGYVSNEADYSFRDIPNVTEVYRLVQQMQREARQGEV